MRQKLDTDTFLVTVARYGVGAHEVLRNQGFVEKMIVAAGYRELHHGYLEEGSCWGTWTLTSLGWSRINEKYREVR